MTSPPSLETSRKIFKNGFSYGFSREAISRTDFLKRYFYLQDFSNGFLEKKLMWWQADEPAGNFYEVTAIAVQGFFR